MSNRGPSRGRGRGRGYERGGRGDFRGGRGGKGEPELFRCISFQSLTWRPNV